MSRTVEKEGDDGTLEKEGEKEVLPFYRKGCTGRLWRELSLIASYGTAHWT